MCETTKGILQSFILTIRKVLLLLREMINTKQVISSKNFKMCFFNNILINFKTKTMPKCLLLHFVHTCVTISKSCNYCTYVTLRLKCVVCKFFCLCMCVNNDHVSKRLFVVVAKFIFCKGVMFYKKYILHVYTCVT